MRAASGQTPSDNQLIARTHRQLLSMAQMRREPVIINRLSPNAGPAVPYRILSCPLQHPGGKATGVRLQSGERIQARAVAANVGPKLLYEKLIAPEALPADFRRRIDGYRIGSGTLRMNVALSELFVMVAVPAVLVFSNSVNPADWLTMMALLAVLLFTKNIPLAVAVRVGRFEELLMIPAPVKCKALGFEMPNE